jgi:signal peptidase II
MESSFQAGKYLLPGLAIICSVILVDQYTKWLVVDSLRSANAVHVGFLDWLTTLNKISYFINEREVFGNKALSPFLNLVVVWNQGISFGMMDSNSPHMALVFIALSLIISLGMTIALAFSTEKTVAAALSLIIGGALGNVVDRVRFNAVADFLDFHFERHHWPAFNVADSCIVIGAGVLMLRSLLGKESAKETT